MITSKISLLKANTLELHYWFNDNTHTMDAFTPLAPTNATAKD